METITGLRFVLLILCFVIKGECFPNSDAELMNCLESDREALLDFKNGLHDPENRLSSWKGSNCCQWWGISCENSTGAVIAVDLHNPHPQGSDNGFWNLSGQIRPSLKKLKSLKHLDLSLNTFPGIPIPDIFGSLKNLQYLDISNAGFSGTIPPSLGSLSNLQYLDVNIDPSLAVDLQWSLVVDDLEWMMGLVSLKQLVMNGVDLSKVEGSDLIRILNKLPRLTELYLSSSTLASPILLLTC